MINESEELMNSLREIEDKGSLEEFLKKIGTTIKNGNLISEVRYGQ